MAYAKQKDFLGAILAVAAMIAAILCKGVLITLEQSTNSWQRIRPFAVPTAARVSIWMNAKNSNFTNGDARIVQTALAKLLIAEKNLKQEVQQLDQDIMLDPVELQILGTLNDEGKAMRPGDISGLLDITYQLVGKRTEKLRHGLGFKGENRRCEPERSNEESSIDILRTEVRVYRKCLKFLNTPLALSNSSCYNNQTVESSVARRAF